MRSLVIQLARFGDLIQTKRLVLSLMERGEVGICVDRSLEELARLVYPGVEVFPVVAHGTGVDSASQVVEFNRKAFDRIQAEDFDEIYNINFTGMSFRLAALFEAQRVRGYWFESGQERRDEWASLAFRWAGQRRCSINLVDFWAGFCDEMIAPQAVNPEAGPRGGGIGVALAGRNARRSLPMDVLAPILTVAWEKNGRGPITLLGSGSEAAAGKALIKELSPVAAQATTNLAGKTGWQDLVRVVEGLDMVITPDTGIMHLAAHLGVPVTAFFLSSAWCFETGPYGAGHKVWQASTQCLPCLESQPCNHSMACLNPFEQPSFLRLFSTLRAEHQMENLLGLTPCLDEFGQDYEVFAGEDLWKYQRESFRKFVTRHRALGTGLDTSGHGDVARRLYRESDWMTPGKTGLKGEW